MPAVALYQPDIPQNLGSILRLCACLDVPCHIIEPCGFILDDKRIRRVGMDYIDHVRWLRHASWHAFTQATSSRIVLLSTKAEESCYGFSFREDDVLLLGRESAGVPAEVSGYADAAVKVPMAPQARSLNVAMAAGIVLGEALRQARHLPVT